MTSLAGEELGRIRTWYTHPSRQADHDLASPTSICDMPQHMMEPVLVNEAVARGTNLRFRTEYLSLAQDADAVTVRVRDRLRGDEYDIRARYVIGADGGRSKVAEDIGLPMVGDAVHRHPPPGRVALAGVVGALPAVALLPLPPLSRPRSPRRNFREVARRRGGLLADFREVAAILARSGQPP